MEFRDVQGVKGVHGGIIRILNQKNLSFKKKEYIGSTAQKKTNKITKFLISAFL